LGCGITLAGRGSAGKERFDALKFLNKALLVGHGCNGIVQV
jgi:hypothetical protein